jgi:hypothetical protein
MNYHYDTQIQACTNENNMGCGMRTCEVRILTILRKQALNRLLVILLIGIFQLKISFIGAKLNPYLQEPSMVRSKRI